MQITNTQLNTERLNGNKLFLHTFKNFSTSSSKVSAKVYTVHALVFILASLSLLYIVIVVSVIFNIIEKKETLADINNTNFNIAKLEKEYNRSVASLTKEHAISLGFLDLKENNFAVRKDAAASLSFLYEKSINN